MYIISFLAWEGASLRVGQHCFGGGTNLSLHLHPSGIPHGGPTGQGDKLLSFAFESANSSGFLMWLGVVVRE